MSGQWIALDTHYFFSPLADRLKARFGAVGLALWPAFLCACKRSRKPGTLTYGSDLEAMRLMGLDGLELVDHAGKEFDLDAFWKLTGQLKQTKRTRRGQLLNVTARHWGEWQVDERRDQARQQKARQRGKNEEDTARTTKGQPKDTLSDSDSDLRLTPLSPPEGATAEAAQRNGNGQGVVGPGVAAALKASTAEPPPATKRAHRA